MAAFDRESFLFYLKLYMGIGIRAGLDLQLRVAKRLNTGQYLHIFDVVLQS